jgi:hypothetical protein
MGHIETIGLLLDSERIIRRRTMSCLKEKEEEEITTTKQNRKDF